MVEEQDCASHTEKKDYRVPCHQTWKLCEWSERGLFNHALCMQLLAQTTYSIFSLSLIFILGTSRIHNCPGCGDKTQRDESCRIILAMEVLIIIGLHKERRGRGWAGRGWWCDGLGQGGRGWAGRWRRRRGPVPFVWAQNIHTRPNLI